MADSKNSKLGNALMAPAIALFVGIAACSVSAIASLGEEVQAAREAVPADGLRLQVSYDDRLFSALGYGIEIDAGHPEAIGEFLDASIRSIDARIMAVDVFYTLMVSVLMVRFLHGRSEDEPRRSCIRAGIASIIAYLLLVAVSAVSSLAFGIPFFPPGPTTVPGVAAGVLGVVASVVFLQLVLSKVKRKALVALLAVPLAFALFYVGCFAEAGLLSPTEVASFDYIADIDPRFTDGSFDGDVYYDEERNVMVVGDTEYEPKQIPNPEHHTGVALVAAIAFEALSPASGTGLALMMQAVEYEGPAAWLYILRAVIVLVLLFAVASRSKGFPMIEKGTVGNLASFLIAITLACGLSACGSGSPSPSPSDAGTTDQMFTESVDDATLYVFRYDGRAIDITSEDQVDIPEDMVPEDGCFYKVTADVDYLNGGVAGYYNYPQVKDVTASSPVSPFDIGLPSISDTVYGVVLIGDYAEGDVLMNIHGNAAVWKDGSWVYRYDSQLKLEDGTVVLIRTGVGEQDVLAGIDSGVLSCEDYFVLPG